MGLDIGTSTIAICSEDKVQLQELAPACKTNEKELRRMQCKMDRSKRSANPTNFNENGTIKKGKLVWVYSKTYENLANKILSLGSDVRVETMRFQSLQKRAKNTTRNKQNGKINSKKRFGKSIAIRAPAMLLTIIDRKFGYQGRSLKKIDTYATKVSQFNHITGEYSKKDLSERWSVFGTFSIQRDLYSAFLIANTTYKLHAVDVKLCKTKWGGFVNLHDGEIE